MPYGGRPPQQNWRGKPLISREVIIQLIAATTTKAGLDVQCCLDENDYPKAIKVSDTEMAAITIVRDDFHGEWNYTISPLIMGGGGGNGQTLEPRAQNDR
jgi:hypothetical protein